MNTATVSMGGRFLSSAGAGGNCACSARLPDPSSLLDKNRAPMGPEILYNTGAGVWRKAPMAFPDSNSVLDKFQSAISIRTEGAKVRRHICEGANTDFNEKSSKDFPVFARVRIQTLHAFVRT